MLEGGWERVRCTKPQRFESALTAHVTMLEEGWERVRCTKPQRFESALTAHVTMLEGGWEGVRCTKPERPNLDKESFSPYAKLAKLYLTFGSGGWDHPSTFYLCHQTFPFTTFTILLLLFDGHKKSCVCAMISHKCSGNSGGQKRSF